MRKTWAAALGAIAFAAMSVTASAQQAPSLEQGAQPLAHEFPPPPPANETAAQRQARWQAWHDAHPNIDAEIAAFVQTSSAQSAAYRARLDMFRATLAADPYAAIRRQSARLTPVQRQEALGIFSNAFALWQAGQFDTAEALFLRGLEVDPANAPANYYFGDILRRRYDNDGAREHFERSVALGPNSQQAALAEVALRTLPAAATEPEAIRTLPPAIFDVASRPPALWDCASCPEMAVIPAGSFTFGDQVRVTLPAPIAAGRFEVTFDEWAACVQAGGCVSNRAPSDQNWGRGRRPVINVSWNDAQEYVTWLSRMTGKTYRLLSEPEWEYVARAGSATDYWWGGIIDATNTNCASCAGQWRSHQTAPVGSFRPNPFGLSDTAGNVWEWTQDCYIGSYASQSGGGSANETSACSSHAYGGGSFFDDPRDLRSAFQGASTPALRSNYLGFRVARTLS